MAKPLNTQSQRGLEADIEAFLKKRDQSGSQPPKKSNETPLPANLSNWSGDEDPLAREMDRIAADNRDLLSTLKGGPAEAASGGESMADLDRIQKEYEELLEEKNEKVRQLAAENQTLQTKIQELETAAAQQPKPGTFSKDDLQTWAEELERKYQDLEKARTVHEKREEMLLRDRERIDAEKEQMREDKQYMERDLGKMEAELAQERAGITRQRNEMQRLIIEIQHEFERVKREADIGVKLKGIKDLVDNAKNVQNQAAKQGGSGLFGGLFGRGKQ
jgi:hypothetical protein